MSIILGNGDALKDLHIGNKIINKVVIGNKVVYKKSSDWPGLKFTSQQDGSTVGYRVRGTINEDIYISNDGKNWNTWDGSNITLNDGEYIYVWNKTNTLNTSNSNVLKFRMSGSISASGNVNSMINFSGLTPNCFLNLFNGCTTLVQAPDLPATQLANSCYSGMFSSCTALTQAPDLPATQLANSCYSGMFASCTALTQAPDLPATQLANGCYSGMFNGCTALTTAPDLPATTFSYKLNCYSYMFENCLRLNSIKLYYIGNFLDEDSNFRSWVEIVSPTGTLYYNGSDTTRGIDAIPEGWIVEQFTP